MPAPQKSQQAFAYEAITVSSTAIGPTLTTIFPSGKQAASEAFITVETNPVRWRADGTDPTSSEGHLLQAGDSLSIFGTVNLKNLKFIRTGSDATLRVTYYY